jgi:hypothetical protein
MGKYLDAIKKISNGSGSALTKLAPNGFVGFVSSQSGHFGKNNTSSDGKNKPPQIEEITQKHESYALTKLTQPPANGFVSFVSAHTERLGEIFPLSDDKNDTRKNDNITPKCTPNELTKPTKLHSEVFHGIEPMTECLHGKPCKWLDCYPGERPGCLKAMDYVFDLDQCPIGAWGPMSPAIVFFEH